MDKRLEKKFDSEIESLGVTLKDRAMCFSSASLAAARAEVVLDDVTVRDMRNDLGFIQADFTGKRTTDGKYMAYSTMVPIV